MIAIIDYGMGNLRSVQKAIENAGAEAGEARIVSRADDFKQADKLVLPGVGAIKPAMDRLNELGITRGISDFAATRKPFLGICLGYQLLFERSSEGGDVKGLGLLKGSVERFPDMVKVPQMGWNTLTVTENGKPVFAGCPAEAFVYFCHSYYVKPADDKIVAAWTDYGLRYASAIRAENVWGVQFHPEKSQGVGLAILTNFVRT